MANFRIRNFNVLVVANLQSIFSWSQIHSRFSFLALYLLFFSWPWIRFQVSPDEESPWSRSWSDEAKSNVTTRITARQFIDHDLNAFQTECSKHYLQLQDDVFASCIPVLMYLPAAFLSYLWIWPEMIPAACGWMSFKFQFALTLELSYARLVPPSHGPVSTDFKLFASVTLASLNLWLGVGPSYFVIYTGMHSWRSIRVYSCMFVYV